VVTPPLPSPTDPLEIRTRLERWRASGEAALVIDHLLGALPQDDATAAWRARVDALRFDPTATAQLDQLVAEGMQLFDRARAGT
jgi:hypothetical protein